MKERINSDSQKHIKQKSKNNKKNLRNGNKGKREQGWKINIKFKNSRRSEIVQRSIRRNSQKNKPESREGERKGNKNQEKGMKRKRRKKKTVETGIYIIKLNRMGRMIFE